MGNGCDGVLMEVPHINSGERSGVVTGISGLRLYQDQ